MNTTNEKIPLIRVISSFHLISGISLELIILHVRKIKIAIATMNGLTLSNSDLRLFDLTSRGIISPNTALTIQMLKMNIEMK